MGAEWFVGDRISFLLFGWEKDKYFIIAEGQAQLHHHRDCWMAFSTAKDAIMFMLSWKVSLQI